MIWACLLLFPAQNQIRGETMNEITFDNLKEAIDNGNQFIDNVDDLEAILRKYIGVSDNSKALSYVEDEIMPHKVGNLKIGMDTIIINVNHALNCFSSKSGYCENCNCCYAKKSSSNYKNSCLYGLASEINFNRLSVNQIIKAIEKTVKEAKNIKFIRFNEAGDFKSLEQFFKANQVAKYFFDTYDIITYTYTHNKELLSNKEDIKNSYIVMNWSIKAGDGFKSAITCNNPSDLPKYLSEPAKYIICLGDCHNCSYCKDKDDLRTVVFINHFKKSIKAGLKLGLTETDLSRLEAQKYIDYGKFLMKLTNQTTLI